MKFAIDENCISCGACAQDCPVQAIVRGKRIFIIRDKCIGCGDCYTICPVGAVKLVTSQPTYPLEEKRKK